MNNTDNDKEKDEKYDKSSIKAHKAKLEANKNQSDSDECRHEEQPKKAPKKSKAGMILNFAYLAAALLFEAYLRITRMVPLKYIAAAGMILAVLFGILFTLSMIRNKASRMVSIVLSALLIIMLGVGAYFVNKTNSTIENISNIEYKVDNMILAVRKDDPAQTLGDAIDYKFAIQNGFDTENTELMVKMIGEELGEEISVTEYPDVVGLAQALINGEIDGAIYNQANDGILDENIEGYYDKVRVLYQYGFKLEIPEEETVPEVLPEESFNVYISGIDTFGDISSTSRSDVNIIMTVNPRTHHILLTNTPRDYFVEFPGLSNGEKDKLTHAGIYGINYSMDALANLYGITIPYYMRVNFTGFEKVIDLLGGVDVNSEYSFSTGKYAFQQGTNHLYGEAALAFARERHAFSSGDNQRGKNQQAVITAVIQKATSPNMTRNAFQMLDSVRDVLQTTIPEDSIKKLINNQLARGGEWTVESQAVIGYDAKSYTWSYKSMQLYVMVPDENSVNTAAQNIKTVMEEETYTDVVE